MSTTTKTLPLSARANTTALKQPRELFTYSRDINGAYHYDAETLASAMSYFYLPDSSIDIGLDLGAGYSKFKQIPPESDARSFPHLLRGLVQHEEATGKKHASDIVTFRGIMTRMMSIPYNPSDGLELYVVPFDGQLFVDFDWDAELARRAEQDQRTRATNTPDKYEYVKRCEYSGYKFEALATIPGPWSDVSRGVIEARPRKTVNNFEQYLSVIRTGIGAVKVTLAGEVDCCWDYLPEDATRRLGHYVELKTSRVVENNMQVVNFEKKLFRTWCQCFLMGVGKVVYGFRDDNLILRNVEVYNTEEIPVMIKNNPLTNATTGGSGSARKINCTNALKWYGAVVEWINSSVDKSDESRSYRLKYDPVRKLLILNETSKEMNDSLRNGDVLTKEFIKWRQEMRT
ncbi:Decapping nuclease RAI1 [Candida viswanathii]|uniref:Decapping nuclease n=1 Tax=Candida viswanathii TaxID=5486 RepID=A0A367XQA3_9ASCO|nr:Decapping nuclease RAI1 [Candida viswanathii]